jgi:catechol 2,3-dioxygenase-like lactoylglutathione lyase family enzyme
VIRVRDAAFVRFGAPDLDIMERFLADFGLVVTERSADALYARGTGPAPYVHVTERGEPGLRAVAFEAASAADLAAAARLEGASAIEKIDAPGAGERVCFTDPDGFRVELVHGRAPLAPLPTPAARPYNLGGQRARLGAPQRIAAGPCPVKRLGHVVLRVSDFRRSNAWYTRHFGFLPSDEVYLAERERVITAFLRCDRGDEYTDHHTFLCVGVGPVGFDHAAFEVEDIDAVMVGHEHLARAGYRHQAGIGRHILGSQVFDYWRDPFGHVLEHFTDGDLLNREHETGHHTPATALGTQWGRFSPT